MVMGASYLVHVVVYLGGPQNLQIYHMQKVQLGRVQHLYGEYQGQVT